MGFILEWFLKNMPHAETELRYANTYELLVAVILSAQCTDKRVNLVTPQLFASFPDVFSLASAPVEKIFAQIRSISYPNNKAIHLSEMAKLVVQKFKGEIPKTIADLKSLPGVGQKTANVVASVAFGIPAIPVDTHVFRVSARLGFSTSAKNPGQTEKILEKLIPRKQWSIAHHWLILHGRYVCKARNPNCNECSIQILCAYPGKKFKKRV